ncbi:helix-turn-helix domain-containing protein [Amycolatopsis sp. NBC_01307]|uniref:AfsR/SARP family transcriptional regulator n=1 Tax=Amycolatopsis sp. NBC_01307 TaxID=2903561 RepID=UPI002E0D41BF|nr:helix-turn-helix domain-containing protein [Amycolatopsis sp. NBC_01307]
MYIGVLGSLQLRTGDPAVVLTGVPAKLLVALIARRGKMVESRDLVALLPNGGRDTLRSHLRKIKSALRALPQIDGAPVTELVNQRGTGYSLHIAHGATDVDRFTEIVDQGRLNGRPRQQHDHTFVALGVEAAFHGAAAAGPKNSLRPTAAALPRNDRSDTSCSAEMSWFLVPSRSAKVGTDGSRSPATGAQARSGAGRRTQVVTGAPTTAARIPNSRE